MSVKKGYIKYHITEAELFCITNDILGSWWVLWPFNHRYKMQLELKRLLNNNAICYPEQVDKTR